MDKIKIFLSYSNENYEFAKELKEFLEDFNLEVFLAHTSIEPTKQWEEEIHNNIKGCHVFLPILTEQFTKSRWTDQECGIAYNENKKFLPISLDDTMPYGFIGKFQTLRFDNSITTTRGRFNEQIKVFRALKNLIGDNLRKLVISSLNRPETSSYRMADIKFDLLKELQPFNKEEINQIFQASVDNDQVHGNTTVKNILKKWIGEYSKDLEETLKEKISYKISPSYDYLLKIIITATAKTKEEIEKLIKEKLNKLDNQISEIGAAQIIASELNIDL